MRPTIWKMPFESGATYSFIPASCLHYPYGDMELTKQWVNRIAKDPLAFTILLGDQFDLARTTYRKHLKSYIGDGNSPQAIDDLVKGQVGELAKILSPIQNKIVGVIRGNHTYQFLDQTFNDQLLCSILKVPYLGVFSMFRVEFRDKKDGKQRYAMPILAHHSGGCKGSRTVGGDTTALKRMEDGFDATIYAAGHTHRKMSFKSPKLGISMSGEPVPREMTKVFIRAGAFLKGYTADYPSTTLPHVHNYAEEEMYAPVDLGYVTTTWQFHQSAATGKTYFPKFELRF